MARVAWTLDDFSTGSQVTYSFEINPYEFESPGYEASLTRTVTTAPNGQVILFGALPTPGTGSMRGVCRTAQQKTDITTWLSKQYPLRLTDDLGDTYDIVFTQLSWTRSNKVNYKYEYTASFTLTI